MCHVIPGSCSSSSSSSSLPGLRLHVCFMVFAINHIRHLLIVCTNVHINIFELTACRHMLELHIDAIKLFNHHVKFVETSHSENMTGVSLFHFWFVCTFSSWLTQCLNRCSIFWLLVPFTLYLAHNHFHLHSTSMFLLISQLGFCVHGMQFICC